jgi:hypothetical protein
MRYRFAFLGGVAVGYVLGARAGRERYEQIVQFSRRVADSPAAQQAAGTVQAQATGLAKTARDKVTSGLQDRVPKVAEAARSSVPKVAEAARSSVPKVAGAAKDKASGHIAGLRRKNGRHEGASATNGNGSYPYSTAGGQGAAQDYDRGTPDL